MKTDCGDALTLNRLTELAYREMRRIAAGMMSRERADHTLQPTALVHTAVVRLLNSGKFGSVDRGQFLAVAASAMRNVLVDHARRHAAAKRGGGILKLTLPDVASGNGPTTLNLLELDEALSKLAEIDERQRRIVELRFFGGLKNREVADLLGVSERTVEDEWRLARMWLKRELDRT